MSLAKAKELRKKLGELSVGSVDGRKKIVALSTGVVPLREDFVTLQFLAEQRKKLAQELAQELLALQGKGANSGENAQIANLVMVAQTEVVPTINREVKAVQDKFIEVFPAQAYVTPATNPIQTGLAALGEVIKAQANLIKPEIEGLNEANAADRVPKILQAFKVASQKRNEWAAIANDITGSDPQYSKSPFTDLFVNIQKQLGDVHNGVKAIPQAMLEQQATLMIAIPAEFPRDIKPEDKVAYLQKRQNDLDNVKEILPYITNATNRERIRLQLEAAQLELTALNSKTPLTLEEWSLKDLTDAQEKIRATVRSFKGPINDGNVTAMLAAYSSAVDQIEKMKIQVAAYERITGSEFPVGLFEVNPKTELHSLNVSARDKVRGLNEETIDYLKQFVQLRETDAAHAVEKLKPTEAEAISAQERLKSMRSAVELLTRISKDGTVDQKRLVTAIDVSDAKEKLENAQCAVDQMQMQYFANQVSSIKEQIKVATTSFDPSRPDAATKLAAIKKLKEDYDQVQEQAYQLANRDIILQLKHQEEDGYALFQINSSELYLAEKSIAEYVDQAEEAMTRQKAKSVSDLAAAAQKDFINVQRGIDKLNVLLNEIMRDEEDAALEADEEEAELDKYAQATPIIIQMHKDLVAAAKLAQAKQLAEQVKPNEYADIAAEVIQEEMDKVTTAVYITNADLFPKYISHFHDVVLEVPVESATKEQLKETREQIKGMEAAYETMRIATEKKPEDPGPAEVQQAKQQLDQARLHSVQMEVNYNITRMAKLESDIRAAMANIDPMRREAKSEYAKLKPLLKEYNDLNEANKGLMAQHAALINTLPEEDKTALKAKQLASQTAYEKTQTDIAKLTVQAQKELSRVKDANIIIEHGGVLGFTDNIVYKKSPRPKPEDGGSYQEDVADVSLEQGASPKYQGRNIRDDEVVRSVKVHTREVPDTANPGQTKSVVTGVAVLEQDNRGTVRNHSTKGLTDEQKEEVAICQAQMLLQNWRRGCGDIIIRGKDPVMANKVFAALLILKNEAQKENPDLEGVKIKSWVPGCSGPQKGWVSSGEKDFIETHLKSKTMRDQAKMVSEGTSQVSNYLHNRQNEKQSIKEAYKNDKAKYEQAMDKHALKDKGDDQAFSLKWTK